MKGAYLGPKFNKEQIQESLENGGAVFTIHNFNDVIDITSDEIINVKL